MKALVALLVLVAPVAAQKQHELCAVCHHQQSKEFLTHPHFRKGVTCNACHGDSVKHRLSEGHAEPDKVAAPAEIPALCGACHTGKGPKTILAQYSASKHGRLVLEQSKVRAPHCGTCHGVHSRREAKGIDAQCKRCHTTLADAHPKTAASVACASCHNPHTLVVAARR